MLSRLRVSTAALLAVAGFALSACAVYEPAPAYPSYGYGYAPGYYAPAPAPGVAFGFNYYDGPRWHHRHWRG